MLVFGTGLLFYVSSWFFLLFYVFVNPISFCFPMSVFCCRVSLLCLFLASPPYFCLSFCSSFLSLFLYGSCLSTSDSRWLLHTFLSLPSACLFLFVYCSTVSNFVSLWLTRSYLCLSLATPSLSLPLFDSSISISVFVCPHPVIFLFDRGSLSVFDLIPSITVCL